MNKFYDIWLVSTMGYHNPVTIRLLEHYGSAENIYKAFSNGDYSALSKMENVKLNKTNNEKVELILKFCEKNDVKIISLKDDNYPELLRSIYNPPAVLFVKGDINCLKDEICVAVVGTRNPSEYSKKICYYICNGLSKVGFILVSGYAVGLDSVAHITAVKNHVPTVAVLASGIDINYPQANDGLKEDIVKKGGCVLTEIFPGERMNGAYFHQRNRIMSGLTQGTLIVQAGLHSGTLITAAHAVNQGRDLFCIPPADILDPSYGGVIHLLRDGATPVFSHLDIINEYYEKFSHKLTITDTYNPDKNKSETMVVSKKVGTKTQNNIKTIKNEHHQEVSKNANKYKEMAEIEKEIADLINENINTIEEISNKINLSHIETSDILVEMELKGYIININGRNYKLCL